jgi:hypothetical protein
LIILGHIFTFKHLCLHSITKILRNGPKAHFPFKNVKNGAGGGVRTHALMEERWETVDKTV